ncbi:MAG: efflux RND transporter permease subunit [Phycisphaerales bacterium]|nr:efflux RND transporter permease subunit [Phycisphaerales bacterium]
MNLIRTCLNRPVSVSVGVLLVTLFGALALTRIPVQLTPTVDVPIVTVKTNWLGANPQEIEEEIVDRQEEMLRSVNGLYKMTSQSLDNEAEITLEFYPGVDKDAALRDVNDKMRQVTGYPLEVDEPTIAAADPAIDSPIAWLILYSEDNDSETPKLNDFAEDFIKPYLDRVKGVANVDVFGGMRREVQVRVDAGLLAARGLTFPDVERALRQQNANISAGTRSQGKRDYTIRTVGKYESTLEVMDTVIAYTGGGPVYIKDVADVELTFDKQRSFVRSKGQYVLALPVRRQVGSNVIEVMNGVRDAINRCNTELLLPRNMRLELTQVYDETTYIFDSIGMIVSNLFYGGALAVVVLLLFLRNWRATVVVALSIPISVIGTFIVLWVTGRTLNVIALAGIAFAVGMVLDNAIVVLENIYRHREMGKSIGQAAYDGASEVFGAVLAGTLTTVAVFLPLIFVRQEAGQLFRDISIATATAVALSLLVSVTVIPPLARRLIGHGKAVSFGDEPRENRGALARALSEIVAANNSSLIAQIACIVIMVGVSVAVSLWFAPPASYLPTGNRNLVFGFLATPPGYSLDEFRRMSAIIEDQVRPYWESTEGSPEKAELDRKWREMAKARIEAGGVPELAGLKGAAADRLRRDWMTPPPAIDNFFFVSFGGGCFMGASSANPARVKPLVNLFNVAGQRIPGVFPIFFQTNLFAFGGGNNAEIQVRGENLDKVVAAASALFGTCMQEFGFPQPDPLNFNLGRPELRIRPNRERAADLGLNVVDIGLIVEAAVDGAYVGDYRDESGETIDISLYVKGQEGEPTRDIGAIPIYTPGGQVVPLLAAVDLVDTASLERIKHIERQRSVTLTVTPPESMALDTVINKIQNEIVPNLRQAGAIDRDVLVSLTGNADKLKEARAAMVGQWEGWTVASLINITGSRFFLSIIIVYMLMAALYESWLYPFVIMFSVPLAIFGGVLGLKAAYYGTLLSTDQPVQQLDVLTFLGFVILIGIVVNNAILLVDQALTGMREKGLSADEAVSEAVAIRVRPVLMTSMTTLGGQLPLALMPGAGSELYRGLAAVMLGGLLVATIGTLILVPVVFSVTAKIRAFFAGSEGAAAAPDLAMRDR